MKARERGRIAQSDERQQRERWGVSGGGSRHTPCCCRHVDGSCATNAPAPPLVSASALVPVPTPAPATALVSAPALVPVPALVSARALVPVPVPAPATALVSARAFVPVPATATALVLSVRLQVIGTQNNKQASHKSQNPLTIQ